MNLSARAARIVRKSLVLAFLQSNSDDVTCLRDCFRVVLVRSELSLKSADEMLRERLLALDVSEKTLDDSQMVVDECLDVFGVALGDASAVSND